MTTKSELEAQYNALEKAYEDGALDVSYWVKWKQDNGFGAALPGVGGTVIEADLPKEDWDDSWSHEMFGDIKVHIKKLPLPDLPNQ